MSDDQRIERRLTELGLELPTPFTPAGSYVHAVQTGDLLVLAGHIPIDGQGAIVTGKVGADLTVTDGRRAARLAALSAVGTIRDALGTLDRVERIVFLRGLVNATSEFGEHTRVVDAASDLFLELFGDAGEHARIAVGVNSLPADLALEIELLVEVRRR